MTECRAWTPESWREFPAAHQPVYDDPAHYEKTLERLAGLPPLMTPPEIDNLRTRIAHAAEGKAFILQGGNCAERLKDCAGETIASKFKVILQMSLILAYGARKPIIRIGRIAGQYFKPRSKPTEIISGIEMPCYYGDAINSVKADPLQRRPDPQRLIHCYHTATATLNYIRALIDGGFADLHHPQLWTMPNSAPSHKRAEYQEIVNHILDTIDFMESVGATLPETLSKVQFSTSHEGLLLGYEQAMTRHDPLTGRYYNLGAHMLWIGARTRTLDSAHVEYFRGIANPVGIKIDATLAPDELVALLEKLNPDRETGRMVLITRLGAERVVSSLPPLIHAVQESGHPVTWSCDPMHGNTVVVDDGVKTRVFAVIQKELMRTFETHRNCNSVLGGVHFEMTAEDVTECMGGIEDLTSQDLQRRYETYCDPRLNCSQSLEIAFLITRLMRSMDGGTSIADHNGQ